MDNLKTQMAKSAGISQQARMDVSTALEHVYGFFSTRRHNGVQLQEVKTRKHTEDGLGAECL